MKHGIARGMAIMLQLGDYGQLTPNRIFDLFSCGARGVYADQEIYPSRRDRHKKERGESTGSYVGPL